MYVFAADFGIHTHDLNLLFHHIIKVLTVEPRELIDETIVTGVLSCSEQPSQNGKWTGLYTELFYYEHSKHFIRLASFTHTQAPLSLLPLSFLTFTL